MRPSCPCLPSALVALALTLLLPSYGLRQVVAQGRYRAIVDLAAGNAWRMQGPSAQAIKLDPSPVP